MVLLAGGLVAASVYDEVRAGDFSASDVVPFVFSGLLWVAIPYWFAVAVAWLARRLRTRAPQRFWVHGHR